MNENNGRKEVRVSVAVRNNLILSRMEEMGYKSVNELSVKAGVSASVMGRLVNMQSSPLRKNMRWKNTALKLAEFFGCLPEDIFSEDHINNVLDTNRTEAEVNFVDIYRFISEGSAERMIPENIVFENERAEVISKLLSTLKPREREVIVLRFGLDGGEELTLEEAGKTLGLTREGARQNEERALGKLRHRSKRFLLESIR